MKILDNYYNQILESPIFSGMDENELKNLLACFNARVKTFENGEIIFHQGDIISNIYLILDGEINVEKDSYWGRRIIISRLGQGQNFALSFIGSKNTEASVDAVSATKTTILILSYQKCTNMCQNACTKHQTLINNLFHLISKENIELIQKIENISQKTIREKLLTYLSNESQKNHSHKFEIKFNRQDLADYLNVDRSAMSFELSKLQKEGLIDFWKNKFELKRK